MTIWRCQRFNDFVLKRWPDGGVLFDNASGNLHEFTAVACDVLAELLTGSSITANGLAETLIGECPTESDIEMVDNLLMQFESISLVGRVGA